MKAFVKDNRHVFTPGAFLVIVGEEAKGTGVILAQTNTQEMAQAIAEVINLMPEDLFKKEMEL